MTAIGHFTTFSNLSTLPSPALSRESSHRLNWAPAFAGARWEKQERWERQEHGGRKGGRQLSCTLRVFSSIIGRVSP
ncbi:hypothetical protein SJA_C1-13160 [Sphingobium indicum UT26S]|uniref:Uncharacterized protein n=1 Tax=Sphingobium indicum (strain DSM 16413 / CCM 7287 / MTCC 6362 / UT26 / NBRC 101211 / UT26S) TaxID=452662 RepID=D4Z0L8_SPHIU|nr:hypothetical protein SJA_C1-13160 [Sphingobium indicum UT26S]